MRVALVHNPTAGRCLYERNDLVRLFRERGYEIDACGKQMSDIERAIATRPDVLAVAGGDGTVTRAAIALCGLEIPLLVFPTGTSNNIANALGVEGTARTIVDSLATARQEQLDIGEVTAPWGQQAFVEAAGAGFIGAMLREEGLRNRIMRLVHTMLSPRKSPSERSAEGVARLVRRQAVRSYQVIADGDDLSGDYVSVEIMNIPAIGPRVILAPRADPADELLDVVLVRPEDRLEVAEHVASRGTLPHPQLFQRRVRRVEMSWVDDGHVDDEPWPERKEAKYLNASTPSIRVELKGKTSLLIPTHR